MEVYLEPDLAMFYYQRHIDQLREQQVCCAVFDGVSVYITASDDQKAQPVIIAYSEGDTPVFQTQVPVSELESELACVYDNLMASERFQTGVDTDNEEEAEEREFDLREATKDYLRIVQEGGLGERVDTIEFLNDVCAMLADYYQYQVYRPAAKTRPF